MLTAVIHVVGESSYDVHVMVDEDDGGTTGEQIDEALAADEGPSPIAPEGKELLWGLGAFVVFLVVMRLWLVPKVKRGMDARYGRIRGELEESDAVLDTARREVEEYEEALAGVRAEAAQRIEAARQVLDGERGEALSDVNARIADRRAAAAAQAEEAKAAQREAIEAAAAAVAARIGELALGRRPDDALVRRSVAETTHAGVGR